MAGPHPALAAVRIGVRRALADLEPGATVLVACSGGADSLALVSAAVHEARGPGVRVVGVTVDHGLQEGSADHAAHVADQMRALGVDESVSARVTVSAAGMGPEAAAREARYEVLRTLAERFEATRVLLGHTLDDQAETVLLGLTRGSGARSLQGMRRGFEVFARPLLDCTRAQTELACQAEDIAWWVDPHNLDRRFTRVRVRTEVMPLLEETLGPGVAATLARTADQLRDDVALLDATAESAYDALREIDGALVRLPVDGLEALPVALRTRVLRLAAVEAGATDAELFREHVLAIDALVTAWRGQRWIDLPGHVRAARRGEHVVIGTFAGAV